MFRKNIKSFKLLIIVLSIFLLSACNTDETVNPGITNASTSQEASSSIEASISSFDITWENDTLNHIKLEGSSISFDGAGVVLSGNTATITASGTYVLEGTLDNGQIIVDVANKGNVKLILNNADIYCSDSAPIYVKNSGETIIILAEGTENILSDGDTYVFSDTSEDEPNATLFSKDNLIIAGEGSLLINANYNNGITGKDDLYIESGSITINAVDDGIVGKDMVTIKNGNITITATDDGIKSSNDSDTEKGYILIYDGNFNITAGSDAIQAEASLTIHDGLFNIITGGGSINSSSSTSAQGEKINPWGNWNTADTTEESQSAKGIKAGTNITISGGTFTIDSSDDSLHSNGTLVIEKGDFQISSGDDGIHADTEITINDGDIIIKKSYEGIESAVITINGGNIDITASDDGINAAGGNDGSSMNGRPGQNTFTASSNYAIYINGGNISINAEGDGIDANGSIYMTDGAVTVYGSTNNGNGALDYDQKFEISGGTLITAGSAGMAQAPSSSSSQCSIAFTYASTQKAGTEVILKDSSGNILISFTPEKDFQQVVVSSPEIKTGDTYIFGETEFTISTAVTNLGEAGAAINVRQQPGEGRIRPEGTMQGETMPDGTMPDGTIPERTMPDGTMPDGTMPDGKTPGRGITEQPTS